MCLTAFDEEKYKRTLYEDARDDGVDLLFTAIVRLKNGEAAEKIISSGIPKTVVEKALLIK